MDPSPQTTSWLHEHSAADVCMCAVIASLVQRIHILNILLFTIKNFKSLTENGKKKCLVFGKWFGGD